MKKLVLFVSVTLFFAFFASAQKQTIVAVLPIKSEKLFVSVARVSPDNKADWLHSVGNLFADTVGTLLKDNYPAKVQNINISLNKQQDDAFILTYECEIVSCLESEAMWFFDRRGAFGKITNDERSVNFRAEQQKQAAEQEFKKIFGSVTVIEHPVVSLFKRDTAVASIKEFFLVSPRKKQNSSAKKTGHVPR